ncbi:T9SS type A sorting domain-containing protein [Salibacter halophilus]|uniref:T9SS type A sorting domain-containing protein n=1 Tax=Salibacter halophilus TaxID=1803916 RepID=A0A6N6MAN7_9FLAO|nr:T9SS type A sorting domain-containing protein [Salibacter halophilus]KAB1065906.1 T9SS type A sorting domain-containing protein [Salibacter halophilus]
MKTTKVLASLTLISVLLLFRSNLYGQFTPPTLIESNTGLITNITTADINNDSLQDILVTKKFSANSLISYYLNQDDFDFGQETTIAGGNSQITNFAVGDFNNDNWLDIVSIGDATNSVTLYQNNSLSFSPQVIDSFPFFESDIGVSDIDNDNDLDIVAIGGTTFKVYYNDGLANFTSQTISGPIEDFFDISISDIDSDGFEDVVTGGANISVYKNNNGAISYDSVRSAQIPSSFNLFVRLDDLDNDGHVDLFSEDNNSSGARLMENDGNGNFSNLQIIDSSAVNIRSGTLNDFDNDGDLDIVLIKDFNLYLYSNDGTGNFDDPALIHDASTTISSVHSSDMNNDGSPDIIWSADLSIQENDVPVAIDKNSISDGQIKVYPNPSSGYVFIESPKAGVLTMTNSLGQISRENITLRKGINRLEIDLDPQLYFFKIDLKEGTTTKKVLVN